MPKESYKILLSEKDMPRQWYNIIPDRPSRSIRPSHP